MSAQYSIGIDLGTTNSVLAFAPMDEQGAMIAVLPIPQIVAPGTIERRLSLPSFLLRCPHGIDESLTVSGVRSEFGVVGEYARKIASEQPDRVVAAAKSWLCNSRIDRMSPVLPWDGEDAEAKISPLNATTAFLQHLIDAWHLQFPNAPFAEQQIVLTVPASFDLEARELTRLAAIHAGFPDSFVFLEEPQAALYNWIHSQGDSWRKSLKKEDKLLVVDVGGGTTDLTLVAVIEIDGEVELSRVAVGRHLLVGGDNMDLTLAHIAAQLFSQKGTKLNAWQSISLWHSCRLAKEALLRDPNRQSFPLTVLGRGSKLIGGTVTADLDRHLVESTLVDGFFPIVGIDERPLSDSESGFQEMGLPYEPDSAITKHIAEFVSNNSGETTSVTHLLFNGGVFNAAPFRDRLIQTIQTWNDTPSALHVLGGIDELDQAVACGAAYYAWAKSHGGIRIRGGSPRSYYVGIESTGPAIPGIPRPLSALCVVPKGMEEGTQCDVFGKEVGLKLGKKVHFRFFSSTSRAEDKTGQFLRSWDEQELIETAPLETELTVPESGPLRDILASPNALVPIRFHSKVTELGVLELWCMSTRTEDAWKLELQIRDSENS